MEVRPRKIVILQLEGGRSPYDEWFNGLKSVALQSAVDARLTRVRDGNFGDHRPVGEGVYELRIHKGPGLRVYYALRGRELVILIGGGDKSSQQRDIRTAMRLWRSYNEA